ncbi:EpsG family protein, partial [Cronobacter sakazakii]
MKYKLNDIIFFVVGLALILISGFRPIGLDRDSINYAGMIYAGINDSYELGREPAFILLQYINEVIFTGSITTFFLLFAMVSIGIKLHAIKKISSSPILSLIIYIAFYYILHDMTQIRAGVAAGLFLLAIRELASGKNIKAACLIALATFFHYSAIMGLMIFLLRRHNLNKFFYYALPVIGLIIAKTIGGSGISSLGNLISFMPFILQNKINTYIELQSQDVFSDINIFNFYYVFLLFMFFLALSNYKKMSSPLNTILIKIFGWGLFFFYAFSFIPVMAFRVSEFLCVVIIILFANMMYLFRQSYIYFAFVTSVG